MRKFTALEVMALDPALTPAEVEEVVAELNRKPIPMWKRWEAEEDDFARAMACNGIVGPDGLTDGMRE